MKLLSIEEVLQEIKDITFRELHIHHTWRPNHANFNGSNHIRLNQNMKNYHVNTNGWSDIAQHLSLFPDGKFVTGRPYRIQPASIKGWNNRKPLMVEMIGNFDIGNDKLQNEQRASIIKLIKYFIDTYGESSIIFHRDHPQAGKTCPGTSVIKSDLIREAKALTNQVVKISTGVTKINIDGRDIILRSIHETGNGLTQFIALRDLECLGYQVKWDNGITNISKNNIYRKPNLNVDYIIDNIKKDKIDIVFNGHKIKLDGYSTYNNYDGGKMQFIKIKDLEKFGYNINWDNNLKKVIATK